MDIFRSYLNSIFLATPHVVLFFLTTTPVLSQARLSRSELQQRKIDSIFTDYEINGFDTRQRLKYIYKFRDRDRIPIIEMGKGLEKELIEIIEINQNGKWWELIAFENKIYSRPAMFEKEKRLRWIMYKYKVDHYDGFTIKEADIDLSGIANDQFVSCIKPLENDDLFNVGIRLDKIKDYLRALTVFDELIRRDFKPDTSYFKMGTALIGTNEYVKGIKHWEHSVEINKDYLEAQLALGNIFYENSHWKQALYHYREANRIKPNDAAILYRLAKSLMKRERYNEAYTAISRSLRVDPKNKYAKGVLKSLKTPQIRKLRKQYPDQ